MTQSSNAGINTSSKTRVNSNVDNYSSSNAATGGHLRVDPKPGIPPSSNAKSDTQTNHETSRNSKVVVDAKSKTPSDLAKAGEPMGRTTTTGTTRRITVVFREVTYATRRTVTDIRNAGISASHKISVAIQAVRANPVAQVSANGAVKMGTVNHVGTTFPGIGPALHWVDAAIHSASDRATRKVTAAIHQLRIASAKPSTRLAVKRAMSSTPAGGSSGPPAGNATAIAAGTAGSGRKPPPGDDRAGTVVTKHDAGTGTKGSKHTKGAPDTAVDATVGSTADRGGNVKTDRSAAPTTTGTGTNTARDGSGTVTVSTHGTVKGDIIPASEGTSTSTSAEHKASGAGGHITASATEDASSGPRANPSTRTPSSGSVHPGAADKVTPGLGANASIVFEAYEVRRPEVAALAIGALRYELYKLGYIATPRDVQSQLGSQLALPARTDPGLTAQALLGELSSAHNEYSSATEFGKLASTLSQVVTKAMENPALVVTDQTIRDSFQVALLDLALVDGKLAREPGRNAAQLQRASEDMMAEWIRTFSSSAEITQKKNGPEAERLYMRVQSEREKSGRGALEVTVDDPDAQIYVNEEFQSSRRTITDLVPGRYRVLLMTPNDDARLFLADVVPNQTTHLDVQWAISSSLVISASTAGFVFPSTTHPEASTLACKLAVATGRGSDQVVVLSMESVDDQWRVVASLYGTRNCQLLRRGYVAAERPTSRQTGALARFIAQGKRAPEVEVVAEADPAVFQTLISERSGRDATPIVAPETPDPARVRGWTELVGSVTLVAGGGYAIHTREPLLGYSAMGLGVALGALAIYSFAQDEKPANGSHVTIAPLRSGAAVGWARSF